MRVWFAKTRVAKQTVLIPADGEAAELLAKMGDAEAAMFEIVRPRSGQWNKLYWSLCRTIGENQDPPRDEDSIDAEVRVLAGHYDVMHVGEHEVRLPKRIAFDKLDADGWADYWKRAEIAIAERFGSEYIEEVAA